MILLDNIYSRPSVFYIFAEIYLQKYICRKTYRNSKKSIDVIDTFRNPVGRSLLCILPSFHIILSLQSLSSDTD